MQVNSESSDDVLCPKCGCSKIHAEKRGYTWLTGFIGSGRIVVTCLKCGHKFKPGEGLTPAPPAPVTPTAINRPPDDDETGIPTYKLD